jgi:enamine deaminase RidA (YjgF/YER057c/UK114 family)
LLGNHPLDVDLQISKRQSIRTFLTQARRLSSKILSGFCISLACKDFRGETCRMDEISHVPAGTPWGSIVGYSRAVRVGRWIAVAGTTASLPEGGAVGGDDIAEQTREAIRRIAEALAQLGCGLEHVVRTRIFVTDISQWEAVGQAHGEFFADIRPASTMVEVSALIDPVLLVEVEADAVLPS